MLAKGIEPRPGILIAPFPAINPRIRVRLADNGFQARRDFQVLKIFIHYPHQYSVLHIMSTFFF
jgi:hypothetical protein